MDYKEQYTFWSTDPYFDKATREELKSITDEEEIKDRFYRDLEFGTAGLRGVMGAGTNRMNLYTVRKATQGLANYILKQDVDVPKVAIAFDSRHHSLEFADEAARCLAANGIKAYRFDTLRPTPELSFAVRYLGCIAGINITASHNPSAYNGYKVYWADGAQITPPHDTGIMAEVRAITDYAEVKTMSGKDARKEGLYEVIGKEVDREYLDALKLQIRHPEIIREKGEDIRIVYSPLHGTGNIPVQRILKELGFRQVFVVPEQEEPDGDFPTAAYPNPESKEAFELGLALAQDVMADLVLATDPDADRLGVYVRDKEGVYHALTGNVSGCLLQEYELEQIKELKGLPEDGYVVKTIVTTNMSDAIAAAYGVDVIETLTGFKYIGQQILKSEETGEGTYLFGFEESYGCLIGTHARDKDAVMATAALCEAAAYYATKGKNLWDVVVDMYKKYGYYLDDVTSAAFEGATGAEKMKAIMDTLRSDPPEYIGPCRVLAVRDYKEGTIRKMPEGAPEETDEDALTKPTGLPVSNVLYYELSEDAWVCVRPSGTEPKIKFYLGVRGNTMGEATVRKNKVRAAIHEMLDSMAK